MVTSIKLSKISKVDLRSCWQNEASDFTPWLATEENISLLADALGMNELEVKAQEEHVGPFRADILCVDPGTDKYVLIENQLEKTDHNHLGQILTYAAGLDAVTIIWIAEHFTEEHRAAIDWLNRITAKPNGWSKDVRSSSQKSNEGHSDLENYRYEFWTAFCEYMRNHPSKLFKTQSPTYNHWTNIAIGRSGIHISLLLNTVEKKITIQLYMKEDIDKKFFDELYKHKEEAETAIGQTLDWRRLDDKKASSIDLYKYCDLSESHEKLFEWYKEYTEKFILFFKPIIKKI